MEFAIGELIFSIIGRLFLIIRYRDSEKRIKIKNEKYDGQFSNIGRIVTLNSIAGLFGLLLIGMLIIAIISIVRQWIN